MSIETAKASMNASDNENRDKFLSFCLDTEEYGVEILRVREIIGIIDITPLPQTPEFVKGVINLRGKIIPVIELRTKFNMAPRPFDEETCIIVVEVTDPATTDQFHMGVIVDTVSEVQDIARDQIEPPPNFGAVLNTSYIQGMGKIKSAEREAVLILLDIDKVVNLDDLGDLPAASEIAEGTDSSQPQTERRAA